MKKISKEETYIDHLKELRKRIIKVALFFVIVLAAAFIFVPEILNFLIQTPKVMNLSLNPISVSMVESNVKIDLNTFNITDPLYLYIKVASIIALILVFPYLIMELWLFIKPALAKEERRHVLKYIPMIFFLFMGGIAFGYYILVPYYIMFSHRLAGNAELNIIIGATKYIEFITNLVLMFGVIFQLPVLVMVLSYIGIISSRLLIYIRKYAYFALLLAAAFVTPPDPVSMGIALVPLALLYEMSVFICRINERKKRKAVKI